MGNQDMNSITLTAPAKVNLFLKVLNKRSDAYHNIFTLFERVSLADKIKITKIPKGIVVSSDVFITANPKLNLVYKAAELILKYKKARSGVKIKISKKIPIAAGLGGGSSDAAATLAGINRLFGMKLGQAKLVSLGRQLGADVPFFVLDTAFAFGRSRGDKLEAAKPGLTLWHLIINPGFKVAAKDVYEAFDLTTNRTDAKIHNRTKIFTDLNALESMLHNDLEDIVVAKKDGVGNIIKRLASSLGKKAILSGSGPSVFCLYGTRKEAVAAKKRLLASVPPAEREGWQVVVARTENA